MSKDKCKDKLKDIEKRKKDFQASNSEQPITEFDITAEHSFYRLVSVEHYDEDLEEIESDVFADPGLSVVVEGSGFPELDLKKYFEDSRQNKPSFIGAVKIPVRDVIAMDCFQLKVDPYPYRQNGVLKEQHSNHAQIVCDKTLERIIELKKIAGDLIRFQ